MIKKVGVSYQRVSSGKQATADRSGLDRQAQAFAGFCRDHQLEPAPDALVDAGVSGYRGTHRRKGALGAFLAAAEAGHWPEGTVLVVEDLDRFSREAASHAQGLLLRLFDLGIGLGLVSDGRVIDRDLYDRDLGTQVMLTVRQNAANDYSRKLASRIEAHWKRKREQSLEGAKLAGVRPFWCDWDGSDYVLNHHAATVRRMVALCFAEGLGLCRIAQALNAEGRTTATGKAWSYANVRKVLGDRRLIGERIWRDGTTIPAYFPGIITVGEFERCQELIRDRNRRKGQVGKGTHLRCLFQGHIYCTCGRLLTYQASHRSRFEYLCCLGKRDGRCDRPNVKYDEEVILRALMREKWRLYFRPTDRRSEVKKLQKALQAAEAKAEQHQATAARSREQLRALLAGGELTAGVANMIGEAAGDAAAAAAAAADEASTIRSKLAAVQEAEAGGGMERRLRGQVEAFIAEGLADPAVRRRFNDWLGVADVRIVATDPQRNGWSFTLAGRTRESWALRADGRAGSVDAGDGYGAVAAVALAQRGRVEPAEAPGFIQEEADRAAAGMIRRLAALVPDGDPAKQRALQRVQGDGSRG